jgi:hypothetical protein
LNAGSAGRQFGGLLDNTGWGQQAKVKFRKNGSEFCGLRQVVSERMRE